MRLFAEEQGERIAWSVKNWNRLNFLTATIPEEGEGPKVISGRWREFVKDLRRLYPGLRVIRVLQRHPGGHGWHVHALMDRYIPASIILHQARLAGLGRIDFQMVSRERRQNVIGYVSRYITRDLRKRDASCKGVRLITAAGNLRCAVAWWRRVCDLQIVTVGSRLRASLLAVLALRGIKLPVFVDNVTLFGCAPPDALAEWRSLNEGYAF